MQRVLAESNKYLAESNKYLADSWLLVEVVRGLWDFTSMIQPTWPSTGGLLVCLVFFFFGVFGSGTLEVSLTTG